MMLRALKFQEKVRLSSISSFLQGVEDLGNVCVKLGRWKDMVELVLNWGLKHVGLYGLLGRMLLRDPDPLKHTSGF
jgi:hypothetical protein